MSENWLPADFSEKFPNGKHVGVMPGSGGATFAIQLTSAQLKALQTTAVQLAPALTTGGGYQLYPTSLYAEYVYASVAYTIANSDNAFQIEYTGKSTSLLSMAVTGLVDQTASTCAAQQVILIGPKIAKTNCSVLGLEVKLVGTSAALTSGDGVVNLFLGYDIIALT